MEKIIRKESNIHNSAILSNVNYGQYVEIAKENILENVEIDDFSYTGEYVYIQNAVIGKYVNIAAMVRIGAPQHPMERPTLHHFTYRRKMYGFSESDDVDFFKQRENQKVIIGNDVWIGHGTTIQSGVKIGDGAVIGSGAVVTKDVEAYTIVGGVPSKKIKDRFSEEISNKLIEIAWWDWEVDVIKNRLNDFYLPIEEFIEKYDINKEKQLCNQLLK